MAGAVVIGAGPGLGLSIARRFAQEGMPIALIARSQRTVDTTAAALKTFDVQVVALTADSTDEVALRGAIDAATELLDVPDVVIYNAAIIQQDAPGDLTAHEQLRAWEVNVGGALTAATHVAPTMVARGHGTFIITGGMPEPIAQYLSLSLGKAGTRALTTMLAEHYGPDGVHAATVTIGGAVAAGTAFDPDEIADHYWRLYRQPRDEWECEVAHTG